MGPENFKDIKFGRLDYESNGHYHRFEPNAVPFRTYSPNQKLNIRAAKATQIIGRLNGRTSDFNKKQVELLKLPFLSKEAKSSSQIEGTRSTLTDIFKEDKIGEINREKQLDNEEVRNNRKALYEGINNPINKKTLKKIHRLVLQGVRGQTKNPGEFKTAQNAIGSRGDDYSNAKFVPASPHTTPKLVNNLLSYMNQEPDMIPLIKIPILHYQFEAIHPFRDGNGRVGRVLIMIQMCTEDILEYPLLYPSQYFNTNREEYIQRLYRVSSDNEMDEWINFFLKGIEVQVKRSLKLIDEIYAFKEKAISKAKEVSRSPKIPTVVELLIKNPFITSKEVLENTAFESPQGAINILNTFEKAGILREITNQKSHKVYAADELLKILEGDTLD